ncbi:MAG: GntR family transcriptional regulator [Defluviitaleaceae bacterium]|nr:GntR family transcriptional regulator [Defluviitaleaceae bacterium]
MIETTTVENIYNELKVRIVRNIYDPGEIISENALAAEFNVSRTPVREALKTLQSEKWVTTIPKIGIQVSTIEVNELRNNFEVRKALETLVITTVIEKDMPKEIMTKLETLSEKFKTVDLSSLEAIELDVKYHETLWKLCNNAVLLRYLEELNYSEQRWWYYMKKINPSLKEVGDVGSLVHLTEYIKNKDLDKALNIMHTHLEYYIHQIKSAFFA